MGIICKKVILPELTFELLYEDHLQKSGQDDKGSKIQGVELNAKGTDKIFRKQILKRSSPTKLEKSFI